MGVGANLNHAHVGAINHTSIVSSRFSPYHQSVPCSTTDKEGPQCGRARTQTP